MNLTLQAGILGDLGHLVVGPVEEEICRGPDNVRDTVLKAMKLIRKTATHTVVQVRFF